MSKRDDIIKIWQESFNDSRAYVSMYFDRVYRDDEAVVLTDPQGVTVSSLLLQRYSMAFQDVELPVSYIAGAATRRTSGARAICRNLWAWLLRRQPRGAM